MGKVNKAISEGGGRIAKSIAKQGKLNYSKFGAAAGKAIRKNADDIAKRVRSVSKRRKYLGNTPGKSSRTGREVIARMRKEGKIVSFNGEDHLLWTDPVTHQRQRVPLSECDMGHHPVNAVDYWNSEGIKHGPRSAKVREWMLDPNNYELQPSSYNRSEGAKLRRTYQDPEGMS